MSILLRHMSATRYTVRYYRSYQKISHHQKQRPHTSSIHRGSHALRVTPGDGRKPMNQSSKSVVTKSDTQLNDGKHSIQQRYVAKRVDKNYIDALTWCNPLRWYKYARKNTRLNIRLVLRIATTHNNLWETKTKYISNTNRKLKKEQDPE